MYCGLAALATEHYVLAILLVTPSDRANALLHTALHCGALRHATRRKVLAIIAKWCRSSRRVPTRRHSMPTAARHSIPLPLDGARYHSMVSHGTGVSRRTTEPVCQGPISSVRVMVK